MDVIQAGQHLCGQMIDHHISSDELQVLRKRILSYSWEAIETYQVHRYYYADMIKEVWKQGTKHSEIAYRPQIERTCHNQWDHQRVTWHCVWPESFPMVSEYDGLDTVTILEYYNPWLTIWIESRSEGAVLTLIPRSDYGFKIARDILNNGNFSNSGIFSV